MVPSSWSTLQLKIRQFTFPTVPTIIYVSFFLCHCHCMHNLIYVSSSFSYYQNVLLFFPLLTDCNLYLNHTENLALTKKKKKIPLPNWLHISSVSSLKYAFTWYSIMTQYNTLHITETGPSKRQNCIQRAGTVVLTFQTQLFKSSRSVTYTQCCSWLRHCATNGKVMDLIQLDFSFT